MKPTPRVGVRHALYTRRSKSTGRLLLVLEHELHELAESEITRELLEILVTALGQEATAANALITSLQGQLKTATDANVALTQQLADATANMIPADAEDKAALATLQATIDAANAPPAATV